jgi:GH35 family endo-1,4-beta-xylanase
MKTATSIIALLATAGVAYIYPSTGTTSLREEAAKKNLLFGSGAINPTYLEDPEFAAVLADQFNSLSPENEMKLVVA